MQAESYVEARQREDLRVIAAEVMDISSVRHVEPAERGAIRLVGTLLRDPESAYAYIEPRFKALGYTPLLQENHDTEDDAAVLAMPGLLQQSESRLWLALLLFVLTVGSTFFVGSLQAEGFSIGLGLAYSASILSILLAHELGHYLTARRLGVAVSYPFFIPVPLPPLGTLGAFISIKAPPPDRRSLLAIAIAGPVAGLVVAIPVLLLGLSLSEVQTFEAIARETDVILMEGNSLLYAAAKIAVFGQFLPDGVQDVSLHPVAWAGWVGLLVTALNLMPAGQLDGGHIFYALFGARIARYASWVMAAVAVTLGLLLGWTGWFLWAFLILIFGRYHAPLLNELVPLDNRQRIIAIIGLVLFLLVFTPNPLRIVELGAGG